LRPQGIVDPGAEYDELIQCITDNGPDKNQAAIAP
jgi:hypothetical protein